MMTKLASVVACSLVMSVASGACEAATRTVSSGVPRGMYARTDNPACGVKGPLEQLSDPEVVRAVGKAAGPKAAGVVILVGRGAEIIDQSGGDLAGWIHSRIGNDWSSCVDMCVAAPKGKPLTRIEWSDRNGVFGNVSLKRATEGIADRSTKDFSGWKNFLAFQNEQDQWVVCGTATNWSHNQSAKKRIRITFPD